ncbi:hypothetical protein BOTBODRAFT_163124 [Botryobasidium botryosum FD-172 SS1]|uniref:Mitochondrial carrier protein n=1 Tax=Botryobasidium botryosum (strain FD-172 SS1) TaxID=930990 RepID=A0A067M8R3_BOTB1|nr:hypothetical protein BOTBODRAFT_163124 [Botryobasidium botryosum FD-172 SS1]
MSPAPKWTSHSVIAGAGAGLVSSIVTCPLDVIKTKLQAQRTAHGMSEYMGALGTTKYILQNNGLRGLYRGLGPTFLGYLPTWAIYFTLYDGIKNQLVEEMRRSGEGHGEHSFRDSWGLHIFAAMTAGATGTIVTSPLWVVKTRFMTQPADEVRYRHTFDAFAKIYRAEGISAFYRGLLPSLMGVTHVAVQFPLYEHLKLWFGSSDREHVRVAELSTHAILLCSSASKMTASLVTYPHEVVRTRLQIQRHPQISRMSQNQGQGQQQQPVVYRGVIRTARTIVREEGWRGLYKGLSINLVRTVPNSAVTLLTYELLMRQLARHRTRS